MILKPWMGYERDMASEAAVLVFARNYREARKEAHKILCEIDVEYIDTRVHLLREEPETFMKFSKRDEPHGFLEIPYELLCVNCKKWGFPIDSGGFCSECAEYMTMLRKSNDRIKEKAAEVEREAFLYG